MVEVLGAGDGEFPAGDGELPAGDGELPAGDGELPAGDGESAGDSDGLPATAHTLSVVAEPALLSTSVVALHMVQFVQVFWLDAAENCPAGHATQVRSVVAVPLAAIFWPAVQLVHAVQEKVLAEVEYFPAVQLLQTRSEEFVPFVAMYWPVEQFVHSVHESLLALAEYAPVSQRVHRRSVVLVPFEETYSPAMQDDHAEHDGGEGGGNRDSVTSGEILNSAVGHPVTPQRTPPLVLVRAVHVPVKGETEHGLEGQVSGLMYLSAPPLPSYL